RTPHRLAACASPPPPGGHDDVANAVTATRSRPAVRGCGPTRPRRGGTPCSVVVECGQEAVDEDRSQYQQDSSPAARKVREDVAQPRVHRGSQDQRAERGERPNGAPHTAEGLDTTAEANRRRARA